MRLSALTFRDGLALAALLVLAAGCDFPAEPERRSPGAAGPPGPASPLGNLAEILPATAGIPLLPPLGKESFRSDLEGEDADCWSNRNATGYARSGCGHW